MKRLLLLALLTPACIIQSNQGDDDVGTTCATDLEMTVDTGATITHTAGVDPGYYISYAGNGAWHIDWTCDTKLSALGCEFSGTINVTGPSTATCFQCESDDSVTTSPTTRGTAIQFDTSTSTGLDGVDFTAAAGQAVEFDLLVNQIYQPDLVYVPSNGATATPSCLPISATPSAP
jgi:hypothetical protein